MHIFFKHPVKKRNGSEAGSQGNLRNGQIHFFQKTAGVLDPHLLHIFKNRLIRHFFKVSAQVGLADSQAVSDLLQGDLFPEMLLNIGKDLLRPLFRI